MKRWRLGSPDFVCWIETDIAMSGEIVKVAQKLNAEIYWAIEVILFNSKEDILIFRLTTGV
jgi:hypothetical protein